MTYTLDFGCQCGALRGQASGVSPTTGIRVVCYCNDCQAYAAYLAPTKITDSAGGTEIYQLMPNQLTITKGQEHLRLLRLSPKGLFRWYAACCKTPLANGLPKAGFPFAGVPVVALHPADSHDEAFGPVRGRVNARFARPGAPPDSHPRAPFRLILRTIRMLLGGAIRRRHRPSPFFREDGTPRVEPTVISPDERAALYEQVEPAS